ncbi:hypothetical protein HK103_002407 [Boothiomyces macroporosus]|uniref:Transmembrane protein n=1 Tax=Boothiomyces macroporosus TaxID=261099 RepID=A0AAD5Y4E5_9FUNG|nr:hypothetical protein HK103_002407 [Boothiomyces macroporosus]
MVVFNETNPTPLYTVSIIENPIGVCGMDEVPKGTGCCLSSLDINESLGYGSNSYNYLASISVDGSIPISANNYNYCVLNALDSSALFGYHQLYLLNGTCYQHFYCSSDGLRFYQYPNCQGIFSLPLPNTTVGNFSYSSSTVNNANQTFDWTGYFPGGLFVPQYKSAFEVFSLIFYLLSIIGYFGYFAFCLREFILKRKSRDLYLALTELAWCFSIIYELVYLNVLVNDIQTVILMDVVATFEMAPSLFSTMISGSMLLDIFNLNTRIQYQMAVYGGLTLVFVVLYGPEIVSYLIQWFGYQDISFYLHISASNFYLYWFIFVMIFDSFPPLTLLVMIVKQFLVKRNRANITGTLFDYLVKNWRIVALLVFQVCNSVVYFVLSYIKRQTNNLHNDRNAVAMSGYIVLVYFLHNTFIIAVYLVLRAMASEIVHPDMATTTKNADNILDMESLNDNQTGFSEYGMAQKVQNVQKVQKVQNVSGITNVAPDSSMQQNFADNLNAKLMQLGNTLFGNQYDSQISGASQSQAEPKEDFADKLNAKLMNLPTGPTSSQ